MAAEPNKNKVFLRKAFVLAWMSRKSSSNLRSTSGLTSARRGNSFSRGPQCLASLENNPVQLLEEATMAKFKFLSLLCLMFFASKSFGADSKTEAAKALLEAQRANARVTKVETRVGNLESAMSYAVCELRIHAWEGGRDPYVKWAEADREAVRLSETAICKETFLINIEPAYNAWKARNGRSASQSSTVQPPDGNQPPADDGTVDNADDTEDDGGGTGHFFGGNDGDSDEPRMLMGIGAGAGFIARNGVYGPERDGVKMAAVEQSSLMAFGSLEFGSERLGDLGRDSVAVQLTGGYNFAGGGFGAVDVVYGRQLHLLYGSRFLIGAGASYENIYGYSAGVRPELILGATFQTVPQLELVVQARGMLGITGDHAVAFEIQPRFHPTVK